MARRPSFATVAAVSAVLLGGLAAGHVLGAAGVSLPQDFRSWNHVKSMAIFEGHPLFGSFGGIHHVYVNDVGRTTYETGKTKPFPNGTVIIFDLLEARRGENTLTEGARKLTGMMIKNTALYGETGGWGYYAFGPAGAPLAIDPAGCHACHEQAAKTDHVFSTWRR
ncbi:MAG: cytochrome C [Alphaproteobacteria bacterium]|nr:MAG: cytochrome C [Alphaproteobacteria bacterium]